MRIGEQRGRRARIASSRGSRCRTATLGARRWTIVVSGCTIVRGCRAPEAQVTLKAEEAVAVWAAGAPLSDVVVTLAFHVTELASNLRWPAEDLEAVAGQSAPPGDADAVLYDLRHGPFSDGLYHASCASVLLVQLLDVQERAGGWGEQCEGALRRDVRLFPLPVIEGESWMARAFFALPAEEGRVLVAACRRGADSIRRFLGASCRLLEAGRTADSGTHQPLVEALACGAEATSLPAAGRAVIDRWVE